MGKYIFFYFINDKTEVIKNSAPIHSKYWSTIKTDEAPSVIIQPVLLLSQLRIIKRHMILFLLIRS
jgi:hypothetical protein